MNQNQNIKKLTINMNMNKKKSQDLSKENEKLIANNNNFDDLQKENMII